MSSLFICNNNENICNDTFYEAKCSLNNVSPLCILPQAYLTILPERCIYRRLQKVLQAMLSSLQRIRKYKLATIILIGHFKCELKTYTDSLIRSINAHLLSSYSLDDMLYLGMLIILNPSILFHAYEKLCLSDPRP